MIEDWRQLHECQPFIENDSLYIVVNSEYESLGGQRDSRLSAAVYVGIDLLLKFYGKDNNATIVTDLYNVSEAQDYFVSYKPCVPMKVLVRVPQSEFNLIADNPEGCNINVPEEYLEARLSIYEYAEKINFVAHFLESHIPALARSSLFISNVNVLAEIKRLKKTVDIIDRYMIRNDVDRIKKFFNPCTDAIPEEDLHEGHIFPNEDVVPLLRIGYTYDYKVAFALIDEEQYTIGYDCFIENGILNHITTANFLINLDLIYDFIISSGENTFDIFDFYQHYLLPEPVIMTKQKQSDGLPLYDENGISFGFADLAKLLALEMDVNLCKTPEQLVNENNKLLNRATRAQLKDSANQITKLVGDYKLSSQGVQNLRTTIKNLGNLSGEEAFRKIYDDVLTKVEIACTVNEALRCYIDNTVELVGEAVIDGDSELGELIDLSFTLGAIVDARCGFTRCDGSPDIDFSIGFPIFQGIQIPADFPTIDYLSDVIDEALHKLYAALIASLSSAILGVLNNSCSLLFDDILGEGVAANTIKSGYQDWLSKSLGINYNDLNDPDAWSDALTTAGGKGFMGALGNMVSRGVNSGLAAYEDTGISFNAPNSSGVVEKVFVSPQTISQFCSTLQTATESVNAITTPNEQVSLYKGSPSDETVKLIYTCAKLRDPNFQALFEDENQFADMFSEMGKLIKPEYLNLPPEVEKVPPRNFCDLGDGSEARILRESILSEKDINMPQEEINDIIEKEIQHNTEKIRTLYELLNRIINGGFAPAFPKILGGEDALIPKMPPLIDEIIRTAAAGSFGTAINNFNASSINYSNIWNDYIDPEVTTLSPASDIYKYLNTDIYFETGAGSDVVVGNYKYGYALDEGDGKGVKEGSAVLDSGAQFAGAQNFYFFASMEGNFKSSNEDFISNLMRELGPQGLREGSVVYDDIMKFLEKHDDSGNEQTNSILYYDPDNTLISYSIITYREGGWGSVRTDVYDIIIIQTVYDAIDQPQLGKLDYNYGEVFQGKDEDNMIDLLERAFPDLQQNQNMRDAIIAYAKNDMDEFGNILTMSAYGTGATVALFTTPMITGLSSFLSAASSAAIPVYGGMGTAANLTQGAVTTSKIFSTLAAGAGAIVVTALVIVALLIALYLIYRDPPPRATRLVVPTTNGSTVTYDVIADHPEGGKISVIKREVPAALVEAASGVRPNTWPSELVSLKKDPTGKVKKAPELELDPAATIVEKSDRYDITKVIQWEQNYNISPFYGTFGSRNNISGLSSIDSVFQTEQKYDIPYLPSMLGDNTVNYSYAAMDFGNLVASSLVEYFPNNLDTVEEIATEAKKRYATYTTTIISQLYEQIRQHILSNRYWADGSMSGMNLTYPYTDIFDYGTMIQDIQDFSSRVLQLEAENTYCDNLSAVRRTNATFSLKMLIRSYVIEQALISIQVLDSLDPTMIESEVFIEYIYNLINKQADIYRASFQAENRIFTDIVNNAVIYYEIKAVLGDDVPELATPKDSLKQMIREEVAQLVGPIGKSMSLTNRSSSWNRFIVSKLFSESDAAPNTMGNYQIPAASAHNRADAKDGAGGNHGVEYKIHIKGSTEDRYPFELYGDNWTGQKLWLEPPQQGRTDEGVMIEVTKHSLGTDQSVADTGLKGYFPGFPDEVIADINSIWDNYMETHVPTSNPTPQSVGEQNLYRGAPEPYHEDTWSRDSSKDGTITKVVDNETWTVDYDFEIVGKNGYKDKNKYTKYKIKLNISSELPTDSPYMKAGGILTPFDEIERIEEAKSMHSRTPPMPDGFMFERYIKVKRKNAEYQIFGPETFFQFIGDLPSYTILYDEYEYIKFGYRLVFITDVNGSASAIDDWNTEIRDLLVQIDPDSGSGLHPQSQKEKALIMDNQPKNMGSYSGNYYYVSLPLFSYECEYTPQATTNPSFSEFLEEMNNRYESEIFLSIRDEFMESEEFNKIFDLLIPLKDMSASLMMYQYSALSDEGVFAANLADDNLYNMLGRTKISVLQIFDSAIYGSGKVVYDDIFTQKLKS